MKNSVDSLKSGKKKVIFDMCINIVAAALPIAMLQLIIYPQVAKNLGGDDYGLMLTIYSIWIMVTNSLGNVLNNIKLLRYPQYQELGEDGDVALLLRQWLAAGTAIVFVVINLYFGNFTLLHGILGSIVGALIFLKAYLEVGFRIKLNFGYILINNALLSIGYLIGFFVFRKTGIWEFIFLIGYLLSCVFCEIKTRLLKEKAVRTSIFQEVSKDSYSLVIAAVINNLINYADKLVLYPLMGGTAVSIYYTATILGKITGMMTGPINSVILSYISRWDKSKAKVFSKILMIGAVIVAVGYGCTLLLARPVINLLFPQWIDEVMEIIPLTTVTIMLTVLASFLQPFVMKYCKMQWQIGISAIGSGSYFLCALILWGLMELKGFCIGTIVGGVVKLIIMVVVYQKSTHGDTANDNRKQHE